MISVRESVRRMTGYKPGEQINSPDVVKLNTNENPYPPSPQVVKAVQSVLASGNLRKYPQPLGDDFRTIAGTVLGVDPESILVGNGSDDILTILTRGFVPEDGLIVSPTPSYSLYRTLAALQNSRFETVPFNSDWSLPETWPFPEADLTLLANPNSPSGTMVSRDAIIQLAKQVRGPLVLDEAYADFAEWNGLSLLAEVPNLIITRSFSKYYSLAGIRFGMAIAAPSTIRELVKVKDSYNCDMLSLVAASAAISDQGYYAGLRDRILATRSRLQIELKKLGFTVTKSHANFLWCRHKQLVKPVYESLKRKDILIRYMSYPDYGDGLRISIGTDTEIDKVLYEIRREVSSDH